jgi:hypothetical protein
MAEGADINVAAIVAENARLRRLNKHLMETVGAIVTVGIEGLDVAHGEPDLEDGGDAEPDSDAEPDADEEPSLSATNDINQGRGWAKNGGGGMEPDREDEHDGSEDNHDAEDDRSDAEWSLGWTDAIHQGGGDQGLEGDREGPDDDLEPDADGEWVSDVCDPRDPIDQRELERSW